MQFSVAVRNARLDAVETTIGTAPKLQIRTGAAPANCAAADTGTLLVEMDLPSDFLAAAASGQKALAGSWTDVGVAAGVAGHYRVKDTAGTTTHIQGPVSESGGGGELILENTDIAVDQDVTITAFTLTDGNA